MLLLRMRSTQCMRFHKHGFLFFRAFSFAAVQEKIPAKLRADEQMYFASIHNTANHPPGSRPRVTDDDVAACFDDLYRPPDVDTNSEIPNQPVAVGGNATFLVEFGG